MKKTFAKLWFKPYTPIILLLLAGFGLYQLAAGPIQEKIKSGITIKIGSPKSDTEDSKISTASALIAEVKDLFDLPQDEEPEIVTITDIEKFKDQPFFKKAANGNKLLIYPKSKKAILYDQQNKKILDVGPITNATESAKQLAEYCAAIATQSGQVAGVTSSPSPTGSPSPTPTSPLLTTSPTAEPTFAQ